MGEGEWRRDKEMARSIVECGPGPRCSLEATMSCFRAHLGHLQAVFFGKTFSSVVMHHMATGLSLVTSHHVHRCFPDTCTQGLPSLGDWLTTLFNRQLCWLQPSYLLQIVLTRLL